MGSRSITSDRMVRIQRSVRVFARRLGKPTMDTVQACSPVNLQFKEIDIISSIMFFETMLVPIGPSLISPSVWATVLRETLRKMETTRPRIPAPRTDHRNRRPAADS